MMSDVANTTESRLHQLFEEKASKRAAGALTQLQKDAFDRFASKGLPAHKSEAYKFTPIARILDKNLAGTVSTPIKWELNELKNHFYQVAEANHLVFLNGELRLEQSVVKSPEKDLKIRTIDRKSTISGLGEIAIGKEDVFNALNLGLFENGLYLETSKKSDNLPVFVYHFLDGSSPITSPRVYIHGEASSTLSVVEKTFFKGDSNILVCSIVEAEVKENACIHFTKLQNYSKQLFTVEGIYAHQSRDSKFYTHTFSFQGGMIRNNVGISIDGENCEGHMNGLYQIAGESHVDNNTAVDHRKPNSFSNETYKGIIDEKAHAVFNGRIYVRPDAQKTNAFQSNNNILLSDTAIVNTKPQLEIWADDVKCSHGCTTGQLDEEAIFYLRSRGIEKTYAKALLLNSFANAALLSLPSEEVKSEVEQLILSKLGQ